MRERTQALDFLQPILVLGVIFVLAWMLAGCGTQVSNGDGQLARQNEQAADLAILKIEEGRKAVLEMSARTEKAKRAILADDPSAAVAAMDEVLAMAGGKGPADVFLDSQGAVLADIKKNSAQMLKGWGGPAAFKDLEPYSPAASAKARETQDQEHSTPWYLRFWAKLTAAGALCLTLSGYVVKYGAKLPFVGQFLGGRLGEAFGGLLTRVMSASTAADKNGDGKVDPEEMMAYVKECAADPKLSPYVQKALAAVHLDLPTSAVPPTPPTT